MFKITWVRASPSVRGMEAARSKSESASVNTKMFRAGKFSITSMSKNTGKECMNSTYFIYSGSGRKNPLFGVD